eukprot:2090836-Rhodomonas_salina.1
MDSGTSCLVTFPSTPCAYSSRIWDAVCAYLAAVCAYSGFCMRVCASSACGGTGILYGTLRVVVIPDNTMNGLLKAPAYPMSGTHIRYATSGRHRYKRRKRQRDRYTKETETQRHRDTDRERHTRYPMSGTDIGYGATRRAPTPSGRASSR